MPRKSPFKHHRFPREIILCAVRWYLRYPLSYQDVVDLLSERGIAIDRSTVFRWVQKFGPELTKRTEKYLRRASVDWHVDETYIRVGGKWRYLWRAVDANGQMVDFRLTARRDAKDVQGATQGLRRQKEGRAQAAAQEDRPYRERGRAGTNDSAAAFFEDIDISAYVDSLRADDNILAIHGLNVSTTSSDFLILPELIAGQRTGSSGGSNISPSARHW